jgi:hypothetical protein
VKSTEAANRRMTGEQAVVLSVSGGTREEEEKVRAEGGGSG